MRPQDLERLLLDSPLFDEEWYALVTGVGGDRGDLVRHYLDTPVGQRVTPQPLFDPVWVARHWEDAERDAAPGTDLFLDYVVRRAYEVRTSPLLTEGYVRRPVAQNHPHGPVGHLLSATAVGELPEDPWRATRGRRPFPDLRGWMLDVVRRRQAGPVRPTAEPDDLCVLVGAAADWRLVQRTVRALERTLPEDGSLPVVLTDPGAVGTGALSSVMVEALAVRSPLSVTVVPKAASQEWSLAAGRRVLLAAGTRPVGDWWSPLLGALDEDGVGLVGPVLVSETGTVRSAGVVDHPAGTYDLLADHPVEDVTPELGGLDLHDVRSAVVAVGDVTAGAVRVCPTSLVVVPDEVDLSPSGRSGTSVGGEASDPWPALGFEVVEDGAPPVVCRPVARVRQEPPRLRWALRVASTPGEVGDAWGDTHFAASLARSLRRLGQEVVVDRRGAFERPTTYLDDVALVIRGLEPMRPVPGAVNLCWVISHPDLLGAPEARAYDRVLAASSVWAQARAREWGIGVEVLLQATDPQLFVADAALADTGAPVLFVGSSRGVDRPVVTDALAAGLDLAVHGPQWEGRLPAGVLRGTYVPNDRVAAAYGAAGVVLNDHWDDMRAEGFLSNRLFDAVAAGARVVTDDVVGLGDVFGRSVQPYRTPADLVRLCDPASYDLHFGDLGERLAVAERIRAEHSFDARAGRLLEVALEVRAEDA